MQKRFFLQAAAVAAALAVAGPAAAQNWKPDAARST